MASGLRFIEANTAANSFQNDRTMRRQRRKEDLAAEANALISGAISEEIANQTEGAKSGPVQPGKATPPAAQPTAPQKPGGMAKVTAAPAPPPAAAPSATAAPAPQPATPRPAPAAPAAPAPPSVPPDINTRIAGRLARMGRQSGAVPGLGQAALDRYQVGRESAVADRTRRDQQAAAAQKRQDEMERVALTALATGDDVTFNHYARKSGLKLPPGVMKSQQARNLFARGALVAEKFYKDDPQQAQQFVAAYVQAGGDPIKAFNAAGVPARKPNISVEHVIHGDKQVLALVDQNKGTATFVTGPDGQPVQPVPKGQKTGSVPAEIQMRSWIMKNMKKPDGSGYTAAEADSLARTAKGNPENLAIRYAEAKSGIKGAVTLSQRREAQENYDKFYMEFLNRYRQGGIAPQAPAGQPAEDANVPTYNPATGKIE